MADIGDIKTIVIVMLENRSFDNVLGHLSLSKFDGRTDVDGLRDLPTTNAYDNFYDMQGYKPFATADTAFKHDLPHDRDLIATQLDVHGGQATMGGFVASYIASTASVVAKPPPMGFLRPKSVPMSRFLAQEYVLCDQWFAPLPAGTQPNRAMAFSGTTLIDNNVNGIIPSGPLVLDWLTAHHATWRVYHHGLSFFLLFGRFDDALGPNFRSIRQLAQDFGDDTDQAFPDVIFVEPEYYDSPVHLGHVPNDNHPPLPIGPGEMLLHQIYLALVRSNRWANTLLLVTYDEHGGFFDHVEPRKVTMVPPADARFSARFVTTGVRVPGFVVSPLMPRGTVCHAFLDHTSILQFFAEKFAGTPRGYSDAVSARLDQGIQSLSVALAGEPGGTRPPPPTKIVATTVVGTDDRPSVNQIAFDDAARRCLAHDSNLALARFPELAGLPEKAPDS